MTHNFKSVNNLEMGLILSFCFVQNKCIPCGNGKYQNDEGKFFCYMCGVGLTTRTQESLTRDECRPECEDGHQLDLDGVCVPCPMGEYRSKGVHPGKENNH